MNFINKQTSLATLLVVVVPNREIDDIFKLSLVVKTHILTLIVR